MKTIVNTAWIRSGIAACLLVATLTASSMIVLASPNAALMGELVVAGNTGGEAGEFVTVDGNRAINGFTVRSATTITTPANAAATINLGKTGRVELAPNTSLTVSFDEARISGTLTAGKVKVFNAAGVETAIQTKDGSVTGEKNQINLIAVNLRNNQTNAVAEIGTAYFNNGKTVVPVGQTGQTQSDDDDDERAAALMPLIGIGVIAGAVVISLVATGVIGGDDDSLSAITTTQVASPTR